MNHIYIKNKLKQKLKSKVLKFFQVLYLINK